MRHLLTALLLTALVPLSAQLPSESLLIVNGSSPEALRVANHYIALRNIPDERVLILTPPEGFFRDASGTRWQAGRNAVDEHMLNPISARLEQLNDPAPAALIFSPDWPIHTRHEDGTPVSVTAYIGSRGRLPAAERIQNGSARSAWFVTAEESAQGRPLPRYPTPALPVPMHPTMMLGVFSEPLNPDSIIEALTRSRGADATSPSGSVAIITNNDVRTRARAHQFEPARQRLEARGVPVHLADREADLPRQIIGVLEGAASVPVNRYRNRLVPGAFAEHLTSFAGTLHNRQQTKMTEWIAAGAAGTVGTVDEPMSIWTKFPTADIFERYMLGNTLLEALMQSHGHPWQSLAIGDPLCRPWAAAMPNADLTAEWEGNTLTLTLTGVRTGSGTDAHLYIDGTRIPGNGPQWTWTANPETTGPGIDVILHIRRQWAPPEVHQLRKSFTTPVPQALTLAAPRRQPRNALRFNIEAERDLVQIELWQGRRRLYQEDIEGKTHTIELPHTLTGRGPVRLQARAIQRNGRMVRSNYWVRD
jgi:hypothetical protein